MCRQPDSSYLAALLLMFAAQASQATELAGDFLNLGFGARSLALGEASTSMARGAEAIYWNPARLGQLRSGEFLAMHSEQFAGAIAHDNLAVVLPLGDPSEGGIGGGILRVAVDEIPRTADLDWLDHGADGIPNTRDDGEGDGDWTPGERVIHDESRIRYGSDDQTALLLSHGRPLGSMVSWGLTAKIVRQKIANASSFGMGVDLGVSLAPLHNYRVGVRIADAGGTRLWWSTGRRERVRTSVWAGQAYMLPLTGIGSSLCVGTDARFYDVGEAGHDSFVSLGAEYSFRDAVFARAGVRADEFVAGGGIRYRRWNVDYAFAGHDVLGNTHRIAMSWRIGSMEPVDAW